LQEKFGAVFFGPPCSGYGQRIAHILPAIDDRIIGINRWINESMTYTTSGQ